MLALIALEAYLPSSRGVAVSLVLEVRDILYHPVVDLWQCQSLFGRALYCFSDEIGVTQISPSIPPWGGLRFAQTKRILARADKRPFSVSRPFLSRRSVRILGYLDLRSQRPCVGPCSLLRLKVWINLWNVHIELYWSMWSDQGLHVAARLASNQGSCQPLIHHIHRMIAYITHFTTFLRSSNAHLTHLIRLLNVKMQWNLN